MNVIKRTRTNVYLKVTVDARMFEHHCRQYQTEGQALRAIRVFVENAFTAGLQPWDGGTDSLSERSEENEPYLPSSDGPPLESPCPNER